MEQDVILKSNGQVHRKVFVLEWNDDLSEGWMNIWNLEECLYSDVHTRRDLCRVIEVPEIADKNKVAYYSNI